MLMYQGKNYSKKIAFLESSCHFRLSRQKKNCLYFFQGSNIFKNLNEEDYKLAMKLLEDAILSTDLALYFKYTFIYILDHFHIYPRCSEAGYF